MTAGSESRWTGHRVLLLLLGCCACGASTEPAAPRPNVVLISIDSLRADHLGCYGYGRRTSPAIDRLAAEGALFADVTSSTSWTLPAHATLFTGLPSSVHGCQEPGLSLAGERRTLAESLQRAGYRTAGFWSGPYLHPVFGLAQGFDEYVSCASFPYLEKSGGLAEGTPAKTEGGPGATGAPGGRPSGGDLQDAMRLSHGDVTNPGLTRAVNDWLGRASGPFFLFIHMWDVHFDYVPPPPYDALFDPEYDGPVDGKELRELRQPLPPRDLAHLIALYDGEIAWTDHHVQQILDRLAELGHSDDTLVVLTADHGEEFFEHGRFGHRKALFRESVAVPLILRQPGRIAAGRRVETPVALADVAPTILALAGVEPLPEIMGRSLVPLLDGVAGAEPSLMVSELYRRAGEDTLVAVREGPWKLLSFRETGRLMGMWNLSADPREQEDLLHGQDESLAIVQRLNAAAAQCLEELAAQHPAALPATIEVPPEVEQSLRDLGYVGHDE